MPKEMAAAVEVTAKEFAKSVESQVLEREEKIKFNQEVVNEAEKAVIQTLKTAKDKIKAKKSDSKPAKQEPAQKVHQPVAPPQRDPNEVKPN